MYIDDEPGRAHLIKLNLERTGRFEVRALTNGELALQVVQEFEADNIFLDVIAEQIRADSRLQDKKLIFCTAIVTRDDTADGHNRIVGHPFLPKPVRTKDLLRDELAGVWLKPP